MYILQNTVRNSCFMSIRSQQSQICLIPSPYFLSVLLPQKSKAAQQIFIKMLKNKKRNSASRTTCFFETEVTGLEIPSGQLFFMVTWVIPRRENYHIAMQTRGGIFSYDSRSHSKKPNCGKCTGIITLCLHFIILLNMVFVAYNI